MAERDIPTDPDDQDQLVGETDIEQLLSQAASLAGQIAEETGADAVAMPNDEDAALGAGAVDQETAALDAPALDDRGAAPTTSATDEDEAGTDAPTDDGGDAFINRTEESLSESPPPNEAAGSVDETLAELEGLLQATRSAKPAPSQPSAGKGPSQGAGQAGRPQMAGVDIEQEVAAGNVNVDLSEGAVAEDALKEGTGAKASAKKSLRNLVRSAPRVTRFAGQFAQTAMPATLLKVLRFVDRPFAGVGLPARKRLGVVAAITFVAGAVLLALPFVCNRNPYVDLPP